jgi:hypothetical protein
MVCQVAQSWSATCYGAQASIGRLAVETSCPIYFRYQLFENNVFSCKKALSSPVAIMRHLYCTGLIVYTSYIKCSVLDCLRTFTCHISVWGSMVRNFFPHSVFVCHMLFFGGVLQGLDPACYYASVPVHHDLSIANKAWHRCCQMLRVQYGSLSDTYIFTSAGTLFAPHSLYCLTIVIRHEGLQ